MQTGRLVLALGLLSLASPGRSILVAAEPPVLRPPIQRSQEYRRLPPVAPAHSAPPVSSVVANSTDPAATPLVEAGESLAMEVLESRWWEPGVQETLRPEAQPIPITLDSVLSSALQHSARIQVVRELPLIRETAIEEADAQFDWTSFLESKWNDLSDPVGNQLTTGGPPRYRDRNLTTSGGLRRRNTVGGQFEVAQRFGVQDTNSVFFVPPNQGTSRLTVNYTQPLLRTAGRAYNTSLTVLAQIDTEAARDELSRELQTHLVDVTSAYWRIYLERGALLQRRRLLAEAEAVLAKLEQRRRLDASASQLTRARAAVETRRADRGRAMTEVQHAERRLRAQVNDPDLGDGRSRELVPMELPFQQLREVRLDEAMEVAMRNRPELALALKEIKAAGVRLDVSRNEILPALNLFMETYVAGLRGQRDVGSAWVDQFDQGEPGYSIGLQYERPIGNRAAQARYRRSALELRQLQAELRDAMEQLRADVEVAVREVGTTYREMAAREESLQAARRDLESMRDRWLSLPGSDRSATLVLEDLLDAQERLTSSEHGLLEAQLAYSLSQVHYQRAVGTLLQSEEVTVERYLADHLPTLELRRVPQGDGLSSGRPDLGADGEEDGSPAAESVLPSPDDAASAPGE